MKRKLLLLILLCGVYYANSTPLRIYVSPTGYQSGLAWNQPCSVDSMVSRLTNDTTISDEVFVYFSGGHYYNVSIKLWNLRAPIPNIHLIGGMQFSRSAYRQLHLRDFVTNETVFHANTSISNSIPIWLESFSYYDSTKVSSVDGITITSDNNSMSNHALRLVGGTYVVTHCKIEDYKTSDDLVMLESTIDHNFVMNSLFVNNEGKSLMTAWCKLHMINVTIADNSFTQLIHTAPFGANIDNSVIWGNSEQSPYLYTMAGTVGISHSFVETQRTWMVDDYTNQWNIDPLFTYDTTYPYTCDALSSIFAYGDAAVYYSNVWALTDYEYNYDVAGNFRFYDYGLYGIYSYADAGAYQHYYQAGGSNYNSMEPNIRQSKSRKPIKNVDADIHLWSYKNCIYIDGVPTDGTDFVLYTISGQKVYSASLNKDFQEIQTFMQMGEYIATITSATGERLLSKTVYLH